MGDLNNQTQTSEGSKLYQALTSVVKLNLIVANLNERNNLSTGLISLFRKASQYPFLNH